MVKFSIRCLLPARLQAGGPTRVGGTVGAHIDRGRRALEHKQMLGGHGKMRNRLHGGGAGPDDPDPLVAQAVKVAVESPPVYS